MSLGPASADRVASLPPDGSPLARHASVRLHVDHPSAPLKEANEIGCGAASRPSRPDELSRADAQAASAEVKSLAKDIEKAQGPEIDTMSGWLKSWGEDVPAEHDEHAGMSGMAMPGMMSAEDMDKIKAATGAQFDTMFLTMMIAHHEGAIEMAKTEQQKGEHPAAKKLAAEIEKAQATGVATMKKLLTNG